MPQDATPRNVCPTCRTRPCRRSVECAAKKKIRRREVRREWARRHRQDNRDQVNERRRARRQREGESKKEANYRQKLRREYGIGPEDYERMLIEQNGVCRICRRPPPEKWKRLGVDHDHATGRVRGLLCHFCNVALGHMRDDPALLRVAADYLERA